jgi:hypothetical protein
MANNAAATNTFGLIVFVQELIEAIIIEPCLIKNYFDCVLYIA